MLHPHPSPSHKGGPINKFCNPYLVAYYLKVLDERKLIVKVRGPYLNTTKNNSHLKFIFWKFGMTTIFYWVEIETSFLDYFSFSETFQIRGHKLGVYIKNI